MINWFDPDFFRIQLGPWPGVVEPKLITSKSRQRTWECPPNSKGPKTISLWNNHLLPLVPRPPNSSNFLYMHQMLSKFQSVHFLSNFFFPLFCCYHKNPWTTYMASFVAAPACPLATLPSSTPRVSAYAGQQKSFSFNVGDYYF